MANRRTGHRDMGGLGDALQQHWLKELGNRRLAWKSLHVSTGRSVCEKGLDSLVPALGCSLCARTFGQLCGYLQHLSQLAAVGGKAECLLLSFGDSKQVMGDFCVLFGAGTGAEVRLEMRCCVWVAAVLRTVRGLKPAALRSSISRWGEMWGLTVGVELLRVASCFLLIPALEGEGALFLSLGARDSMEKY